MARGGHTHSHSHVSSRGNGSGFPGTRTHQEPTVPPSTGRRMPPIHNPTTGPTGTPPNPGDAFLAWLTSNPDYMRFHPIFEGRRGDLYANYGIVPGSEDPTTHQWTIDYKTNPFSIFNALLHGTAANSTNLLNQANQAGALYSGASQASQLHEQQAYAGRVATEMQNFKNAFGQLGSEEEGDISNLYPAYTATAGPGAGAPPPRTPPAPPPHPQLGRQPGNGRRTQPFTPMSLSIPTGSRFRR